MPEKKKKKRKAKKPAKVPPKTAPKKTREKAKRVPIEHKVLEMWNNKTQGRNACTRIVPDDQTLAGLRYAAGKDYACTFENVTVQELCERPMYQGIDVKKMQNWCTVDGWVEHRREFREQYRRAMQKAIGNQLVQTRLALMKRGEKGLDRLFKKLVPEDEAEMLEPSSLEALANATRQFWNQVIQEKEALADAIMPASIAVQDSGAALPMVRPELSQSEARAAALTIVRMRREEQRAALVKKMEKEGLIIEGQLDGPKVDDDRED